MYVYEPNHHMGSAQYVCITSNSFNQHNFHLVAGLFYFSSFLAILSCVIDSPTITKHITCLVSYAYMYNMCRLLVAWL